MAARNHSSNVKEAQRVSLGRRSDRSLKYMATFSFGWLMKGRDMKKQK